ncbi:UDP-glucose 4-epimerase family protein [Alkalimarinus alittae]|uniref:SDR family oxidoreductase n=1 Tax=Alkalimarinus alittae TaxID=2961619 RepID=A0ABY6MZ38_9ALTE|nr:SDR family oxidoreductase [Alkalimarinus alittae]UZE95111.1 SDR family oxidoreductase [Alkalimarinus alittae]
MSFLLTGYTGFLGSQLREELPKHTVLLGRAPIKGAEHYHASFVEGEDYSAALNGVECVIHCAARVHVMDDSATDPLSIFRAVNTEGTLNLAEQAAKVGVKRFIFISSIKVNGEQTLAGNPFKPDDENVPDDPYALSKYEAEIGLRELSQKTGMEVVIIRPPLVYGPGVKGNFTSMMRWLENGVPLPLGAINNLRSLVSLDNLVDLIKVCIEHPQAANETFLVSDDNDLSTTQLLSKLVGGLGAPKRLFPVPTPMLNTCAYLLGKKDIAQRLLSSLQVDISKTKSLLKWSPPHTVNESLNKTARYFLNHKKSCIY